MKKLSMEEMIQQMDAAKKANPLDLSSDQDLSIGLITHPKTTCFIIVMRQ